MIELMGAEVLCLMHVVYTSPQRLSSQAQRSIVQIYHSSSILLRASIFSGALLTNMIPSSRPQRQAVDINPCGGNARCTYAHTQIDGQPQPARQQN